MCDRESEKTEQIPKPTDRSKIVGQVLSCSGNYDLKELRVHSGEELIIRIRFPEHGTEEIREIADQWTSTSFIRVDHLMKLEQAGYRDLANIPARKQPSKRVLQAQNRARIFQ